jgi:hypothetical protein
MNAEDIDVETWHHIVVNKRSPRRGYVDLCF